MAGIIVLYVLIFGGLFFFMNRSTKKRQNKYQTMISGIVKGTKVMTRGGIIGEVTKVDEESFTIKSVNSVIEIHIGGIEKVLVDVFEDEEEIAAQEIEEKTEEETQE